MIDNESVNKIVDNPRKRYVCIGDVFKIGCGFIAGIFIFPIFFFFVDGPFKEHERPIQYYQVTNGNKTVTIHSEMSRDSVIILLGQPSSFESREYHDEVTYSNGLNYLNITFNRDGKVSEVVQR